MALIHKKSYYDYDGSYCLDSASRISQAERRLSDKKLALEDMQNELDLLEEQTLKTYKSNVMYFHVGQKGIIDKAKTWLSMLSKNQDKDGNKLDGRKKYEEKQMYDYYIGSLKELLGIEEMENVQFIDFNFGQATEIEFKYKSHKWRISIPHIDKIDLKAFKYCGNEAFKLKITHNDIRYSCSWSYVGSTYEEDALKDIMQKGIEKYCGDE